MQLALEDSRRLTGPNLVSDGPGAIIDVRVDAGDPAGLVAAWHRAAEQILAEVGWREQPRFVRVHEAGVNLVMSAPIDALYAATEVNEWALEAAVAALNGEADPPESLAAASRRLQAAIEAESNPALIRLRDAAAAHGVMFLSDDDDASVGMGAGSRTWSVTDLPDPADVPWPEIYDVPLVMVTGTNGKTTTVRLLAAMARESGRTPGFSSTDGVFVGDDLLDGGDYSGPGGARAVLRDRRVEAAILETARGGMLRRGLGAPRADGVLVSNVGVDHVGEYGLHGLDDIAEAKLVIGRAVEHGGLLVLNADDPVLARRSGPPAATLVRTSRRPDAEPAASHIAAGGQAVVVEDGGIVRHRSGQRTALLDVDEAPVTLGGAAVYNVENVLAALALAPALGVADENAVSALRAFEPTAESLPGRTNLIRFGDLSVLLDFAHNPHGMDALAVTALALPAQRRLVVIGQAGDRDDASIRALVRSALGMRPDVVVIKEMRKYLRGREPGEVRRLIRAELEAAGDDFDIVDAADELAAARAALEWSERGDLLVLPIQAQRDEVLGLLRELDAIAWRPGKALPGSAGGPPDGDSV